MSDSDEFFDATPELSTIRAWARARYAAPKATLGAVLLRVAASTEPSVQLPGVIGGPASLNMGVVFVSKSGGGKGISDKVGRLAWPADIIERPIGSGEGIAAMFVPPKKDGVDPVTRAILSAPEIDTLAGVAARQGSILLAQLKSALMGELLGQSNASEATTRIVQAHAYRCCLSIGAQPGHADVLFNDTSGGTPQRLIWLPTTDPAMPPDSTPDPQPLNVDLPAWSRTGTVITYGPEVIKKTIIEGHLARQRGEGEALDGHALLTRCKVAAVLAVLHHRSVVSELDWQLSGTVMAWSDATRDWLLEQARVAARAKVRERAISRAVGEEFYDSSRLETVKRSILRMLERDGEQQGNVLRSRLGRKEKRELFDQAIGLLEADGLVSSVPGLQKGTRYRIGGQGDHGGQGAYSQVSDPDRVGQGDHPATVTDLDSRRSHESRPPKVSCQKWFDAHIAELRAAGNTTADSFAVYGAGQTAGYSRQQLRTAASAHPGISVIDRARGKATWDITGRRTPTYKSAADFITDYLNTLPQGTTVIDRDNYRSAAQTAGYSWTAARHAALNHPRIQSVPAEGDSSVKRLWIIQPNDSEESTGS